MPAFLLLVAVASAHVRLPLASAHMLPKAPLQLPQRALVLLSAQPPDANAFDDENSDSSSEYDVDWDSAWKRELAARADGSRERRPAGREPVEIEIDLADMSVPRSLANFGQQLPNPETADYKFWIGARFSCGVSRTLGGIRVACAH